MDKQVSYYAVIPATVRYDKNVSPNAKLLYGEISALTNKTGVCWATNSYFAELYGVSDRTVVRWLNELINAGHIDRTLIVDEKTKELKSRQLSLSVGVVTKMSKPDDKNVNYNNTEEYNNNLDIDKSISKKKNDKGTKCWAVTREELFDEDVIAEVDKYMRVRLKKFRQTTPDTWRELLVELKNIAPTKEDALEIVKRSRLNEWGSFFPLKKSYSNTYKDNIPDKPKDFDEEDLHREEFRKTFQHLTMSERPNYKEWKKEKGYA